MVGRPGGLVLPHVDDDMTQIGRLNALRERLAEDAREMFEARIEVLELQQVVEGFIAIVADQGFQMGVDLDDIHQVAMLVQSGALQLHFDLVMMRVPIVLRAPIATDEEMLGDKISFHRDAVHRTMLLSSLANDVPLRSIRQQYLNGLLRTLIQQGIGLIRLLQWKAVSDKMQRTDVL